MFSVSLATISQALVIGNIIVWGGLGSLLACVYIKSYYDDKKYQKIADDIDTDSLV